MWCPTQRQSRKSAGGGVLPATNVKEGDLHVFNEKKKTNFDPTSKPRRPVHMKHCESSMMQLWGTRWVCDIMVDLRHHSGCVPSRWVCAFMVCVPSWWVCTILVGVCHHGGCVPSWWVCTIMVGVCHPGGCVPS